MSKGRPKSIRTRLTTWYSVALACGLLLFAIALWVLLKQSLYADLQKQLAERTASLQSFIANELKEPAVHLNEELEEYAHGLPAGTQFWLINDRNVTVFRTHEGSQVPTSDALSLWTEPRFILGQQRTRLKGRAYRIVGAVSADEARATLRHLRIVLVILLPGVVLIASVGGLLLSQRALRPVDRITDAAKTLSIHDLSGRLPVSETGDEIQRLSETWNSMLDRLQEAVDRLYRFTQDASHELRTPLAIIRSTAEIAGRRSRSEEAYREAFMQIVAESDRLTNLVQNLLLLARADGPAKPEFSPLSLVSLVMEVCSEMRVLADLHAITLEPALATGPTLISGNELLLRRLLVVLIDNAIRYSRPNGAVVVSVRNTSGSVEVQVIDHGIGIAPQDMHHIFGRFYRGEDARDAWSDGAGLGLSLAASIVQQHGAAITVRSKQQVETVFTVTFSARAQ